MRNIQFFNKEKDNFRWTGFCICRKIVFGFGFSFGLPLWIIPRFKLVISETDNKKKIRNIFDIGGGWILLSVRCQILDGRKWRKAFTKKINYEQCECRVDYYPRK